MCVNIPVVFFLSITGAWLVLQSKACIIWAIVTGSGGAVTTRASGHRAGPRHPWGVAARPLPHSLVHHLHSFKHTPRVVPARRNRAKLAMKRWHQKQYFSSQLATRLKNMAMEERCSLLLRVMNIQIGGVHTPFSWIGIIVLRLTYVRVRLVH